MICRHACEAFADAPAGRDSGGHEHDPAHLWPALLGQVRCIRLETVIAAPVGECFDLSLSVDAHTASMRGSSERAIGGVTSGLMKLGDTVTWRGRHFGVVFCMTAAITEYQYPSRFVDEQLAGPFRRWWHEHTFIATASGETVMSDVVQFQSPLGPLGSLADRLVLDRYMPHLLRRRNTWLKTSLEALT